MRVGRALRGSVAVLLVATALSACGTADRGSLSILIPWTAGRERDDFNKVISNFTHTSAGRGISVQTIRTRATKQALEAAIRNRRPPDLAVVPTPGVLRDYVQQGKVARLDGVLDQAALQREYGSTWLGFERVGTGGLYAVVVKANVKSLLWYNTHTFPHAKPATWTDLTGIARQLTGTHSAPWCMAMSDPPNSGWPGTDWIEDILLHRSGPATYTALAEGTLSWRSQQVKDAWRAWGDMVAAPGRVYGGRLGATLAAYGDGSDPMFTQPPGCYLSHGAMIAGAAPEDPQPRTGVDTDFFPFPSFGRGEGQSYEVSADLMAMFESSPQARAFLKYLTGAKAQEVWPAAERDQAFTPNRTDLRRRLAAGPSGTVSDRIDRILTSDRPLCFDASDWMPDVMANAFYRATLTYLSDPTDARLDTLTRQLDAVQRSTRTDTPTTAAGTVCGPAT
jgi:alpha-glucoside transport system substrate-binding protein